MSLQKAYDTHKENANFYWVYISEAHATDDARPSRTVKIKEHTTLEERKKVAAGCAESLELKIPLLVDDMKNSVAEAYSANPDRLFIIDTEGKIAFAGERGPWGFDVSAMVTKLETLVK